MKRVCFVIVIVMGFLSLISCTQQRNERRVSKENFEEQGSDVRLIVLAPGHFHANLLQKTSIKQVNDSVHIYAPSDDDSGLHQYQTAIHSYNNRTEDPTNWQLSFYTGSDFVEKMIAEGKGNVVVLAGNNRNKTTYIHKAVSAGFNVLSDKPMAINKDDFSLLVDAFSIAESNRVLLCDVMTERYDMLNIVEKELINDPDFFGELAAGTPEEPAVIMESVHHFYKEVSGVPLLRPAWYYDVTQQGEGIADVTTHLIDLLFWKFFPGESIDYLSDISNISANHWPTKISLEQFSKSTGESFFPDYLLNKVVDGCLYVYANGTIRFKVKNHDISMKVIWDYQAPEGGGDTFMSTVKGTKAILKTIQNKEQNFIKQLYVRNVGGVEDFEFEDNLKKSIHKIQLTHPFVSYSPTFNRGEFLIEIPEDSREGHESHFRYVAENFFDCMRKNELPEWENANNVAKYYITTEAVHVATESK